VETLQLRISWLVDGLPESAGIAARPPQISDEVVKSLADLGFNKPRIACESVTSLAVKKARSAQNHVEFEVPVMFGDSIVRLRGQGGVELIADGRYVVGLRLAIVQPIETEDNSFGGGSGGTQFREDSIRGSIATALGHYTVLGTSVVIPPPKKAGSGPVQYPSAFVVQLKRARDFPAGGGDSRGQESVDRRR